MPVSIDTIDIRRLSETYDKHNRDTFVSLYLQVGRRLNSAKFIAKREKQCFAVMKSSPKLASNFVDSMREIKRYLVRIRRGKGLKGVVLFASKMNNFFESYKLALPVANLLVVDTSPYIRPLTRLRDEYETFGLVLLDDNNARLYLVESAMIKNAKKYSKEIMKKHKKGGMSQMRFQRLRREAIDAFFKEVTEQIKYLFDKQSVRKIVIGGPGTAKVRFTSYLPQKLRGRVLDVIDVDFDIPKSKLIRTAITKVLKAERLESLDLVDKLCTEVLRNGCTVHGLRDTIRCVRNGQADTLIITKDFKKAGWICERCQRVRVGTRKICPYCNEHTAKVDVIEEIIEFAERTNTNIEFVRQNELLDELGKVGALLRYK